MDVNVFLYTNGFHVPTRNWGFGFSLHCHHPLVGLCMLQAQLGFLQGEQIRCMTFIDIHVFHLQKEFENTLTCNSFLRDSPSILLRSSLAIRPQASFPASKDLQESALLLRVDKDMVLAISWIALMNLEIKTPRH